MTQINFGDGLVHQLRNENGAQPRKPLKTWFVSSVDIKQRTYYLYVEKLTGLPVLTRKPSAFVETFATLLHFMGFLTERQQESVFSRVVGGEGYVSLQSGRNQPYD